jgi:hypothetical protein
MDFNSFGRHQRSSFFQSGVGAMSDKPYKPSFEFKYLEPGSANVNLTPDDIFTLKLLRDAYAQSLFDNRSEKDNFRKTLETIERILEQVK